MRTLISSLSLAFASMTSVYAATDTQPSIVEMQTNLGTITFQLELDKAPITSKNFLDYATSGFYKNTIFHRSIKDFVVQGGGFDVVSMASKPRNPTIPSEANNGLLLTAGSVSMALAAPNNVTDDHSATSEFFINMKDNTKVLSGASSFTVFAHVISGMDIVSKINAYPTVFGNVPYANDSLVSCGLNFCLRKIYIENVYTSNVVDTVNSINRVTINGLGSVTTVAKNFNCVNSSSTTSKTCPALKKPVGENISLVATAGKGYQFQGWSGDCSGTTTPFLLNTKKADSTNINSKSSNNNCTATFTKIGA